MHHALGFVPCSGIACQRQDFRATTNTSNQHRRALGLPGNCIRASLAKGTTYRDKGSCSTCTGSTFFIWISIERLQLGYPFIWNACNSADLFEENAVLTTHTKEPELVWSISESIVIGDRARDHERLLSASICCCDILVRMESIGAGNSGTMESLFPLSQDISTQ
jgi:hypothetical protein